MKFDVLDNQSVVEAQVSDHNIVIEGVYASFNVLTQCQNYEYYYNNGFKIHETDAQYADRLLNKTISVIKEMYDSGVRVFMLQEAPALRHPGESIPEGEERHYAIADEFYARLQEAVPELNIQEAVYSKNWGSNSAGGLLTLVDKSWSDHLVDTTNSMKNFVSEGNQERFQSFDLYLTNESEPIKIANFHADFAIQNETKTDINYFVSEKYVIGGDFNLIELPVLSDFTGVIVFEKTDPGLMPTDTYDAIFFGDDRAHDLLPNAPVVLEISSVLSSPIDNNSQDVLLDTNTHEIYNISQTEAALEFSQVPLEFTLISLDHFDLVNNTIT